MTSEIQTIGLPKETESPENPGGLERRVALIPGDVKVLVDHGVSFFVQKGAGEGLGYPDSDYSKAGAKLQSESEIYTNKDMVIKFKGPSLESVSRMTRGTILFCMGHFRSFQDRAKLLQECQINVISMEEILESPKKIPRKIVLSKRFMEETVSKQDVPFDQLHIGFLGYNSNMVGGLRRCGNRNPQTLTLYQSDIDLEELDHFGKSALYFYDSRIFKNTVLISKLKSQSSQAFDLKIFLDTKGAAAVEAYRISHPAFEFGQRRIQCLHETGVAGARYGFSLLEGAKGLSFKDSQIKACVLGYGNVGMGAIHECYDQGVRTIKILGRAHTRAQNISSFLEDSDLIVNGAEQAPAQRGVNYLIKREHIGTTIKKGSVVIDLIGGSASNRSPVEDIVECTYLTKPHFERNGVIFSALWGWPMMGLMKESAIKYSGQILDVLLGQENLLKGLGHLTPGVKRALVCGPF